MASEGGQRGGSEGGAIRPGQLSALLQEIAAAPTPPDGGWGAALLPGATIGKFELVREIGSGGFGVVWEARDRELNRSVAFKAVRAGGKAGLREERLLREAEAAARLSHPNIVTLFDLGRAEPGPYLVLELLGGQTLEERLQEGKLPVAEAVRVAGEVAKGVAHAHAQGVVHRDLKPANVFLCQDGQVKVLDFGLAHAFGQRRQDGGTPAYMAPEQWEGAPEDERTDVFALGVMLFRMLAGELPFADPEGKDHRSKEPAPALEIAEQPALGELVARMLAKRVVERPRDGAEVAETLRALQHDLDRAPAGAPAVRTRRRPALRLLGLAVAGALAGALVAGGFAWWRLARTPQPVAGADGRIVVAVADFANETRDPDLDGLAILLVTSLEQSRKLRVVTRSRMSDVLRQMGKDGAARIDEPLAREVGRREGVRALFLASVRKLGETYAVDMRGLDPERDEYLFALREQVREKGDIFALVDRLSERARRALQEPVAEVRAHEVRVAEAATSSVEAWRHYAEGLVQEGGLRLDLATASWRKAVAVDPRFALAWLRLAVRGFGLAGDERRLALESALRASDRLPEKDRLLAEGWKARLDGRRDDAIETLTRAANANPRDKELAATVAGLLRGKGSAAAAVPWWERAQALDPTWGEAMSGLVDALVASGRSEEAIRRGRAWVDTSPGLATAGALASALQLAGRPGEAVEVVRRLAEIDGGSAAKAVVAEALILADRAEEAERLLRPLAEDSREQLPLLGVIDALTEQGRRREALGLIERISEEGFRLSLRHLVLMGDRDPGPALREGRALFEKERKAGSGGVLYGGAFHLGDPAFAAASAAMLPQGHGPARAEYEALFLWSQGEKRRSLAALRALEGETRLLTRRHWWRARLAYELGEVEEGDAALQAFEREPTGFWRGWGRAQALVWSAEAHARKGDRAGALAALDRLERIWARADKDLPQLADARSLRKRLVGQSAVPATRPGAGVAVPSIAVLPFADMSPGEDQEYFADGVAEEILNALTQVPGLKVIGRTSSFSFKGKSADLKTIGRKLGAGALLEGSVRKDGARLRVTAKLVRAEDGAGTWSRTFEGDQGAVFAVQDEIARSVVEALRVSLVPGRAPIRPTRTDHPEVYASYLRGREQYRRGTPESLRQALAAFEQALARESSYAAAWAGVSEAAFLLYDADPAAPDLRERALSAAEKAIALAPELADGYYARSVVRIWYRFDWAGAEADLARVAALNPGHARGPSVRGRLLAALGRTREGLTAAAEATTIDPLDPEVWVNLGVAHGYAGDLAQARAAYERALRLAPAHYLATGFLCAALVADGKPGEALALAERSDSEFIHLLVGGLVRRDLGDARAAQAAVDALSDRYAKWGAYLIASVHAWRGDRDRAFEWLDRSQEEHDAGLANLRRDPLFSKVRADPRWKALLRKMNLPVE